MGACQGGDVVLDAEHADHAWAKLDDPPQPLHPGVKVALERLGMDELGVARAMVAGDLVSPQRYKTLWLFDIRITGTGLSFRSAKDDAKGKKVKDAEYVWRDPSIYLNDEFLARCNGLPVIFEHPKSKPTLDEAEFDERSVGTVFLPYVRDGEVWAIAKVYDESVAAWLSSGKASTSPAVVLGDDGESIPTSSGPSLLIEDKPVLLDHIALVPNGVWDKGGPPSGVRVDDPTPSSSTSQENVGMADPQTKADSSAPISAEAAAALDAKLDRILDSVSRAHARMDAAEDADKERKDAEAKERDCMDAARKDRFGGRKDGESYKDWKGRQDADEAAMMDALTKGGFEHDRAKRDAMHARRDAEEEHKKDESFAEWAKEEGTEPEHKAADKKDSKKDAGGEEEPKTEREEPKGPAEDKKDARKDGEDEKMNERFDSIGAENRELKAQLARLQEQMAGLTHSETAADRDEMAAAYTKADGVAAMFGDRAPLKNPGESPLAYRKRLLKQFIRHSAEFKDTKLDSADAALFGVVEGRVYADAVVAARKGVESKPGLLVPHVHTDESGRRITSYHGDSLAWMQHFMTGGQNGYIVRPQRTV